MKTSVIIGISVLAIGGFAYWSRSKGAIHSIINGQADISAHGSNFLLSEGMATERGPNYFEVKNGKVYVNGQQYGTGPIPLKVI